MWAVAANRDLKHGSVLRSIDELITEVEAHIRNHQAKLQRQLHRRV
ncbi:MAG: hypothetical protein IMX00_00230 [Limnochordales bacterium]|nr:hypothetical protein [Limnochordales bacterium]